MAKSLGQIHTVNTNAGPFTAVNQKFNVDLPGELTDQLQRMVRAGTFHKLVGIDMTLNPTLFGPTQGATISGRLRYFVPTRGRCAAYRAAFKAMAEVMKQQGITMRDNKMYDFRAPLNEFSTVGSVFPNQATLDGLTGLCLTNSATPGASIFGVHNAGVQPVSTTSAADLFDEGFNTLLQARAGGTDFILNDALPFTGSALTASEEYEEIPFVVSYEPSTAISAASVVDYSFRPDPVLYIAILCGQIQVVVDEIALVGGATNAVLTTSFQVSGWKSIMGNPDKKPRKRMKAKTSDKKKKA